MHNVIPDRIRQFLVRYPPFDRFRAADLDRIVETARIRHLESGEIIFREGTSGADAYFMVFQGGIDILYQDSLIDRCDEGDLFGVRLLLAESPYLATARASEESLVLCLDREATRTLLPRNPEVALFMAASFASGKRNPDNPGSASRMLSRPTTATGSTSLTSLQPVQPTQTPVHCPPGTPIRQAAKRMEAHEVGSMLICNEDLHPVGIFTDKDLRNRVVAGSVGIDAPVESIMKAPVITCPPHITMMEAMIIMLRHRIHHLCMTATGSPDSPALGILSEHDLLVAQGNHPAVLIRDLHRAQGVDTLAQLRQQADTLAQDYLRREVSVLYIARILTEINDALIRESIRIAARELDWTPPVPFAWMGLGSEGRGEQLLRSDQDNAIIFSPPEDPGLTNEVRNQFLSLASRVNAIFHQCGFEDCPAEIMARNPTWCLTSVEWAERFHTWMHTPGEQEVMHANIFFDFRNVYGDTTLTDQLSATIADALAGNKIFLSLMAKDAVRNPPPLSFFRNFIVEKDGEHRDQFDIKLRAMMPLIDAARTLTLYHGQFDVKHTVDRLNRLADLEPQNRSLYQEAAEAFEILMRFRAENGLRHQDSGRYLQLDRLSKLDRLQLRNCFHPIRDLQEILETRFQLNLFSR
ncbi:MAG TPA: DUF294 nucleotidyltransferase-like domain-containing protein [Saprospiraceae bacterium]|nr:DUF294 nucleotidyltransferase-like domain-containing protein [Saprospiraceae bacterium]